MFVPVQKTASLKETLSSKARSAKQNAAAVKKQMVQRDLEERSRNVDQFVQIAGAC